MNPAELNLNPLSQIDPVVIVAVALIVGITYLVLRRVYVLPYLAVMEERESRFAVAREQSTTAEQILRDADLQAETLLSQAATGAEDLRTEAASRAEAYRKERIAAASLAASQLLEAGRAGLRETRDKERSSVKEQAVECVALACDQLLGTSDSEAIEATVDRLMERTAR